MIRKKFFAIVMGLILLSACSPAPVDISAEETQLAQILMATLTAGAPTATLVPTDTPMPTETPEQSGKFLNPTSMLETLYPESDGWNWRDTDTSRLSSYYDSENDHILTLIYTDVYFQLGCSASINAWDGEYANSTFMSMLSDFVPADTQSKIMAYFQSQTDLGKTNTDIDGFQVGVTLTEEEETRRVYIHIQQQEG